jgi:hypothetical protein
MSIFFRNHLDGKYTKYRGNLMLPKGATPDDHKAAKKSFLQSMSRFAAKRGGVFRIHATQEIDDPLNVHWDCNAYSDIPVTPLAKAIGKYWKRAGGEKARQSLVILADDDDEIDASTKYNAKVDHPIKYLAAKGTGLNRVWYSKDFFEGTTQKALWHEFIEELKAAGVFRRKRSHSKEPSLDSKNTPELPPESPVKQALKERFEALRNESKDGSLECDGILTDEEKQELYAEIDRLEAKLPQRDADNVLCVLPEAHQDAVSHLQAGMWADVPDEQAGKILDTAVKKPGSVRRVVTPGRPIPAHKGCVGSDGKPLGATKSPESIAWYIEPVTPLRDDHGRRIVPKPNDTRQKSRYSESP